MTGNHPKAKADRLFLQGLEQCQTNQFKAALQSWQQALIIYRQIGERFGEANCLNNLGLACYSLRQCREAIEYYQQSLIITEEIGYRLGQANAQGNLGSAYLFLGQYQKAIDYYRQSLAIAQEIGKREVEAASLINMGHSYQYLGQYQKAIEYHHQSLGMVREIGDREGEANSLRGLGNAFCSLGQYQQAIDYHQQSLAIAQEIGEGEGEGEADSLRGLGNGHYYLGQYQKAIEQYRKSRDVARKIGDRLGEVAALGGLGNAYSALGQYPIAIKHYKKWQVTAQEIENYQGEASALCNLGNVYYFLGEYQRAIEYYEQSLNLTRKICDYQGEAQSLNGLGNVYSYLGKSQQANGYYHQALNTAQKIGDPKGEAISQCNIGHVLYKLKQYPKAINYYHESLNIARCHHLREEAAISLNGLGNAYSSLEQYDEAIKYYQQSIEVDREIGNRRGEGNALNNWGYALLKSGRLAEAENKLRASMKVKESLRIGLEDAHKVSIFERQENTYRLLQEILILQNKFQDALEIAERGRARAFVDLLSQRLPPQLADQVAFTAPTVQKIQQIAETQNAALVEYSIIYDELGEESDLFIWVIKPTGEIGFQSVDLKSLREEKNTSLYEIILQLRSSLGIKDKQLNAPAVPSSKAPELLRQLHQLIVEPIAQLLPTDPEATVIFIPQGNLFLAPLSALQDTTGKFLIEQHTIVTAPSIQVLELTRKRSRRTGENSLEALVVGNPTMPTVPLTAPPKPLEPLPGSEQEAIVIASLLNTQPIIGDAATKVYIEKLMSNAQLIHLATHGLLDDIKQLGVPGAIALAPSDEDNGFLTAGEILEMKLNAELVVLSACSSGQGKITGDGVIGLSRCLFAAGVPSVIVSLWKVGDNSTQFLMTEFYQNLQSGMNKAQALRQAMLTTMKKKRYSRPKSWAAFTLIGEAA